MEVDRYFVSVKYYNENYNRHNIEGPALIQFYNSEIPTYMDFYIEGTLYTKKRFKAFINEM